MKTAILLRDIKIIGCTTAKAGLKLELISKNKRFAYLKFNGCTLKISATDIK